MVQTAAPKGTPIMASGSGTIEMARWWEPMVNILELNTIQNKTAYAHLNSYARIRPGAKVKQGQIIGYVGSTGNQLDFLHYDFSKWQEKKLSTFKLPSGRT